MNRIGNQTKNRKDKIKVSLVGYTNAGKSTIFNLSDRV
ncbi:MAG: 50S ribosome-binding GTPase [Ignavibacteriales bacterium]|nr:50S ribosome-binding GTPase [Ignavibacteriales bacterium]